MEECGVEPTNNNNRTTVNKFTRRMKKKLFYFYFCVFNVLNVGQEGTEEGGEGSGVYLFGTIGTLKMTKYINKSILSWLRI